MGGGAGERQREKFKCARSGSQIQKGNKGGSKPRAAGARQETGVPASSGAASSRLSCSPRAPLPAATPPLLFSVCAPASAFHSPSPPPPPIDKINPRVHRRLLEPALPSCRRPRSPRAEFFARKADSPAACACTYPFTRRSCAASIGQNRFGLEWRANFSVN